MAKKTDKENTVKIGKAKGRPMLTWVGKKPLTSVRAYPAQHVESFSVPAQPLGATPDEDDIWQDWPDKFPRGGLLFHGDNKDVLAHLLANGFRGQVKLIYIDPPFDSGADYVRKVQLRGLKGTTKVDGEEYTLGEQIQYTDIWANDNYLQFLYERLLILKELLADGGALFLHCDERKGHHIRCLLDEIFGSESFNNEIIWHYSNKYGANSHTFDVFHNSIYWYSKGKPNVYSKIMIPVKEPRKQPLRRWNKELSVNEWLKDEKGNYLYQESTEKALGDVWDIPVTNPMALERTDYPTQKPEELLDTIIRCASSPGDLVLDAFVGSGTTVAMSQKLRRAWIGVDINKGALQSTAKRLQAIMGAQSRAPVEQKQGKLIEDENLPLTPAQLAFNTYRVNDYDLQIQHNEAVQLACEHIGVTRTRADGYFDGTLGKRLVKIIPFNHPLTPLDLEDLRQELHRRPEEERDIVLVCLGMELAAKAWIEEFNRARPINKLHVIELRTDKKYGGFIKHDPLVASVSVTRGKDNLVVEVNDVISPTILQRLNMEQGVFRAQIDDWRAVVDCIMIDTDYDGSVFNIALSDIPPRKQDLVQGRYELAAPRPGATVAVKIIDMLGEEAVVTKQV